MEAQVKKVNNDATATIKGTLYQFYIAIEKCYEMIENECVLIEKDGDISTANDQIEVKQYEDDLTDSHINLWKTLSNWLNDSFDHNKYKKLILLTSQNIGVKSKLNDWNKKEPADKLNVLQEILDTANKRQKKKEDGAESQSLKLITSVLDSKKSERLTEILGKFIILDSSPLAEEYYEQIKQKHCKGILPKNKDSFLRSVLGFILEPKSVENNWEISYQAFSDVITELTTKYCSETKVFPTKFTSYEASTEEKKEVEKHLFYKKIEEIEYHEAKPQAISDFVRTQKTLLTELGSRVVLKSTLEEYEGAILNMYSSKYSTYSRNTSKVNLIKDSKNFYDEVISHGSPPLSNYNNTPPYFKNGTIHSLANEDLKNIKWKLNLKDDE